MSDLKKDEATQEPPWKAMNPEELELAYSPSRWSPRFSADHIIAEHSKITARATKAARAAVKCRLDVRYAEGPRALLDVYSEDLPSESPLLVYVHGGYWQWQEGGRSLSASMVLPLHQQGVLTVVLGYDLAPQVGLETMVEQVEKGMAWVCELGRTRGSVGVVLAGWSAGGQLITQVLSQAGRKEGTDLDLVRGVVTLSGIFDLRPLVSTYINDLLHLTMSSAWSLSPLRSVKHLEATWGRKGLKLLLTMGQHDSDEFKRQAREYSQACEEAGLESEVVEVEGTDHFSIIEDLEHAEFTLTCRIIHFVYTCAKKQEQEVEEES